MAKHLIKGFVYWVSFGGGTEPKIVFELYGDLVSSEYADRALIGPHEFEVEVPDNFNPAATIIQHLTEAERLAKLELAAKLQDLNDRKQRWLALPNNAS